MTYRLTSQARRGFLVTLTYVEENFGVRVAERILEELEAAFVLLAERPGIGQIRPDLTDREDVRFWPVGPTLIAYRVQSGGLEILFVERGARNWRAIMQSRS